MESILTNYLEANRESLKDFAGSLLFLSWADLALKQGADIQEIFYDVQKYNIKGE